MTKRGRGAGEEQHRAGDVRGRAPAAHRRARQDRPGARRVVLQRLRQRRRDPARRDGVDADAVGGVGDGQALGQLRDAALAGAVARHQAAAEEAEHRGGVDDAAARAPSGRARAALQTRIVPVRLMSTISAKATGSCSTPRRMTPAQLTTTSSSPSAATRAATASPSRTSRRRTSMPALPRAASTSASVAPVATTASPSGGEGAGDAGADAARGAGDEDAARAHRPASSAARTSAARGIGATAP